MRLVTQFFKDDRGVTAIEYALIATLVALAIIVGATTLGDQLNSTYTALSSKYPSG